MFSITFHYWNCSDLNHNLYNHPTWKQVWINVFLKILCIYSWKTERERGREAEAEGEADSLHSREKQVPRRAGSPMQGSIPGAPKASLMEWSANRKKGTKDICELERRLVRILLAVRFQMNYIVLTLSFPKDWNVHCFIARDGLLSRWQSAKACHLT